MASPVLVLATGSSGCAPAVYRGLGRGKGGAPADPMPNDGDLVDLLASWLPEAELRHRILVVLGRQEAGFECYPAEEHVKQ